MLTAEMLLTVTGIFPTKGHPDEQDLLAVEGLTKRWESRARRWLGQYDDDERKPREFEAPDPPDAKKLQDKLLDHMSGKRDVDLMGGIEDLEMQAAYLDALKAACRYIDGKWPKIPVPGSVAEVFPLSAEELDDVYALVRIADNPEVLWDELEAESLSVPMIECWRNCFPEWSAEVLTMIERLVIERIGSKKELAWQQEDLLHMLRGEDLDAPLDIAEDKPQKNEPQPTGGNAK